MIKPNQYKRGFTWRLSGDNKESLGTTSNAFARLSHPDYSDLLEDFLRISRERRRSRLSLAKLQLWMFEEILNSEKGVKHYKGELEKLAEKAATSTSPEGKVEVTKSKDDLDNALFFHRLYANAIRVIGDGIAWRAFNYERPVMRALCQRATNQTIVAEGTAEELREWSKTFDRSDGLAILNSITNTLSLGDVTVVHDDGTGEIVEVKTGNKKSGRITRQKQKLRETVKLLNSGVGQLENESIEILNLDIYPANSQATLYALLDQASQTGWSGGKVDDCCYLECMDGRKMREGSSQLIRQLTDLRKQQIGEWESQNDFVLAMRSLDLLTFTPNCAPFSVYPFPPAMCIGLLTGALSYVSYFNISALCRALEGLGWQVTKGPDELTAEGISRDSSILDVEKDGFYCKIPPADLTRMQVELIKGSVFVTQMEMIKKMGPGATSGTGFVAFDQEHSIWD
jgi:hypothetical protein